MCAGVLIAQEAGAVVTTMEGEPYTVFDRSLLAAAPGMHEVRSFKSLTMMAGAEDG